MNAPANARPPSVLALSLFAIVALFAWLGTQGLIEPDEGRYAEIGREMAADGDWLMPHKNGFPHFQKPPMLYWATAASIKMFGANAWAARLPSALAALGVLAMTFLMGRALFGRATAAQAVLVLVSSLEFFVLGRSLTPDMMLTFWITAALTCLVFHVKGGRRPIWRWAFFAAMGFGFLTKGPLALVVPVSAAVAWQLAARRTEENFRLPWLPGMLLTLAIGLSWFVALSVREHALFDYFWRFELLERFASKSHGRAKPFWFFAPVLLAGFFPWSFFLPGLGRRAWQAARGGAMRPAHWLLLGWVVPPFVILSLSGSKLPTYILPLFPPLALALARAFPQLLFTRAWRWGLGGVMILLPVLVTGIALFHRLAPKLATAAIFTPLAQIILALLVAGLIALLIRAWLRRLNIVFLPALAMGMTGIWITAATQSDQASDLLRQQSSVRKLATTVQSLGAADGPLFAYQARAHGFNFYLRRLVHTTRADADLVLPPTPAESARLVETPADCAALAPAGQPVYGFTRKETYVNHFAPAGWERVEQVGDFVLIRRTERPSAR